MKKINNLGTFNSLAELKAKYPQGAVEGDYAKVGTTDYVWDIYTSSWVDPDNIPTPVDPTSLPREMQTFSGDVTVIHNLTVVGTLKAKKIKQPNVGLFNTLASLKASYPSPEVGMWAVVGTSVPGAIYACNTAGTWTATGQTGGVDGIDLEPLADEATMRKNADKKLGEHMHYFFGEYSKNDVVFTKDTLPVGTKILVKFTMVGTRADMRIKDASGTNIKSFEVIDTAQAGETVTFAEYTLPSNYDKAVIGTYGNSVVLDITCPDIDATKLADALATEKAARIAGDAAAVTTSRLADGCVTETKVNFIKITSDNLFNKATALEDKLINASNGALVTTSGIITSDYIAVKASTAYHWLGTQTAYGYAFYDADKTLLTYGAKGTTNDKNAHGSATSPATAAYLRVSFPTSQKTTAQVNEETWKDFDEYRYGIDDDLLPSQDGPVDGSRIVNKTIKPEKTTFFTSARSVRNLYNPETATEGKYIIASNGSLGNASTLCVSDYIPVTSGKTYFWYGRQTSWGYAFYDTNKSLLAFGAKGTQNDTGIGSAEAPADAKYLRVSFKISDNASNLVNEGVDMLSVDSLHLESIMGQQADSSSASSMADGDELTLSGFPVYISKQLAMVFSCKFDTFTSVSLGQRNGYVVVDTDNVHVYGNNTSGGFGLRQTIAHGLTISGGLRLMLFVDGAKTSDTTMAATLTLSTATGYKIIKINSWYYTHGGAVFADVSQATTDATLAATCLDFKSPVWAFGDSYFGLSKPRWPYVMRELGYFNYYFEGLGGGTSFDMYHEMEKALKFGTPKYLLWCLGMNDPDTNNTTPNANWLTVQGYIKEYCKDNGIELILATIPNTPTRNNYAKNNHVRNSGYRYIDFALAVNGEASGASWYDGMLNADNVHPNELGAQALASQVLIDFPELMEICKTPATSTDIDLSGLATTSYVDKSIDEANGRFVFKNVIATNLFTSSEIAQGNTIKVKYKASANGSANVLVYSNTGTILKRFETASVVAGQEYEFENYVLPSNYARVYATNYQYLDVSVTMVGWSNAELHAAINSITPPSPTPSIDVVQDTGTSTTSVMSQNAVTTKLADAKEVHVGTSAPTGSEKIWINPSENFLQVTDELGNSSTKVMSQKGVNDALAGAGTKPLEFIKSVTIPADQRSTSLLDNFNDFRRLIIIGDQPTAPATSVSGYINISDGVDYLSTMKKNLILITNAKCFFSYDIENYGIMVITKKATRTQRDTWVSGQLGNTGYFEGSTAERNYVVIHSNASSGFGVELTFNIYGIKK